MEYLAAFLIGINCLWTTISFVLIVAASSNIENLKEKVQLLVARTGSLEQIERDRREAR